MNARNVNLATDLLASTPNSSKPSQKNSGAGALSEYAKILRKTIAQEKNDPTQITKVKRFKPDGSILVTTYEDGNIASQTKIKPHLVPVPDFSAPKTPEGDTPTKWEPRLNLLDLLMI